MLMEGKRFIHTLRLKNLLSYGSEGENVELQPLNVLIGSNASGKSNFIEAIRLLRATSWTQPQDVASYLAAGGGVREWLYKGAEGIPVAEIEAILNYTGNAPLNYRLYFTMRSQALEIVNETLESQGSTLSNEFFYRNQRGLPTLNVKVDNPDDTNSERIQLLLDAERFNFNQSMLSQIKEPYHYPELYYVSSLFLAIHFYKLWNIQPYTPPRFPLKPDLPNSFLDENGYNLALALNHLQYLLGTKQFQEKFIAKFQKIYDAVEGITILAQGGTLQIFIEENLGNSPLPTPAMRLSDGTLRYLCLLTVLLHPSPPPLVCIEEPETGLHPDMLPVVAELLVEASQRTQLIVTTHSDTLVSALPPEAVLVCERDDKGTHLSRQDPERLKKWLENYSLGELWRMGEIGGNRW
jgi:predicted ATPase